MLHLKKKKKNLIISIKKIHSLLAYAQYWKFLILYEREREKTKTNQNKLKIRITWISSLIPI